MSHRELNLQNEPNVKRQRIDSTLTRRIDDCIPNMLVMPFDEHTPIEESPIITEHNNTTLLTCASSTCDENVDLNIEESLNVDSTENISTKSASTEQRPIKESDYYGAEVAAVVTETKHVSELPVELLTDTFDYLSLHDLCAVRQTNTQWRRIAGYCFQHNYSFSPVYICENQGKYGLIVFDWDVGRESKLFGIHGFIQLVRNIRIIGLDRFEYFLDKTPDFQQLKEINLYSIDLTTTRIDCMKEIFNKVEHFRLERCETDEHFIDHIFALSPNLKRLSVIQCETGIGWLGLKHPTLERFVISTQNTIPAVAKFLENNPNIRTFEINAVGFWGIRHSIQTAKIALDDLAIHLHDCFDLSTKPILRSIFQSLNAFYELGIYKPYPQCFGIS